MDNLSAQQKLMGNMQATSAELLSGIMEERGRGLPVTGRHGRS